MDMIGLPPGEEPVTDFPFLPSRSAEDMKRRPYTLVLDLDETLGHYVRGFETVKVFMNYI